MRESANRAQCQNNLKQIGIAFNNYQSANGTLPDASSSVFTALLPYIEQGNYTAAATTTAVVKTYTCPSDGTVAAANAGSKAMYACSYTANFQGFDRTVGGVSVPNSTV